MKSVITCVAALILACPVWAAVDDLAPIESDVVKRFGKILSDEADKFEKPQVKIVPDPDKAYGVHVPDKAGTILVPQKELKEGEELEEKFKQEKGASLGYLFLYNLTPVIKDKPADYSQLRAIKITSDQGRQHTIHTLLLSVRKVSDGDYRLYAYGHDDKPLIESGFEEGTGPGAEPTAVEVKGIDDQAKRGKLVVTVFGKYQASFNVAYIPAE